MSTCPEACTQSESRQCSANMTLVSTWEFSYDKRELTCAAAGNRSILRELCRNTLPSLKEDALDLWRKPGVHLGEERISFSVGTSSTSAPNPAMCSL